MRRKRLAAGVIIGLLLVTFVSPFSYVPNPIGLYYLIVGGYSYDPLSPFVNRFATLAGDPVQAISIKLDRLIGQVGLDPLDPNYPLVSYTVARAISPSLRREPVSVSAELRYADGSSRTYQIPVTRSWLRTGSNFEWQYSALDRFFAEPESVSKTA